jgi:tRNA C32,U32 (ribose-2'-O)-methylase TrmJ
MSAGLVTSTVTPGSTAPDVSLTVPEIVDVCADALADKSAQHATTLRTRETNFNISSPFKENNSVSNPNAPV